MARHPQYGNLCFLFDCTKATNMSHINILQELQTMETFELYQIYRAIAQEIDNPARLAAIKAQLKPNMEISYFDAQQNKKISSTLLEIKHKFVIVLNHETHTLRKVPYYALQIKDSHVLFPPPSNSLNAYSFNIGESVGFTHKGENIIGTVMRLNPKTVTLKTREGHIWRVYYAYLYRVQEGESASEALKIKVLEEAR